MEAKKPVVLLVDDDDVMLNTLVKLLTHFGFSVIAHTDVTRALAALEERNDIAILLCDYEMPHINGEELARATKEKNPNISVFILSGSYPPETPAAPWDAWLLKGSPVTELIRRLNEAIPTTGPSENGPGSTGGQQ